MNFTFRYIRHTALLSLTLALGIMAPTTIFANGAGAPPQNLTKRPLNTVVSTAPNILYILDDSASMNKDYLPEWAGADAAIDGNNAGSFNCRTNELANVFTSSGTFNQQCNPASAPTLSGNINSLPPFRSSDFNSLYYNPEIRYTPPKRADGTSFPSRIPSRH